MSEFNPYISNDGSVGLYSEINQDIYHSVYGALSESWEKFVIPANLDFYLNKNKDLNFLDICYGIGYNSKTLIQFLINFLNKNINNNFEKIFDENFENFSEHTHNDYSIHTDNILTNIKDTETIHTDKNFEQNQKNLSHDNNINTETIHDDNILCKNSVRDKKFLIDSVELDKNLILLSPFIKNKFDYKNLLNINLPEVKKLKDKKIKPIKLEDEFLISDDVLKILFKEIINNNLSKDDIKFLDATFKKYHLYFSKDMVNLFKLYKKSACVSSCKHGLLTFLHNIYYRYLTNRYNKGVKTPYNGIFDINIISGDAINHIKGSEKIYDVVFLDAFTPSKCPKLWTVDFFKLIFEHLDNDGIILTYSNSSQVRNAFLNAGFYVGKIFSESSNKFTGTVASKNKSLVKHELSEYDLGLLKTKAGIFYRDENFTLTNEQIIEAHKIEVENSNLISSSKYIKMYKVNN